MDRIQYSANKLENIEKVINDLPSWPGYCYGDEGLKFERYMVGELYYTKVSVRNLNNLSPIAGLSSIV